MQSNLIKFTNRTRKSGDNLMSTKNKNNKLIKTIKCIMSGISSNGEESTPTTGGINFVINLTKTMLELSNWAKWLICGTQFNLSSIIMPRNLT